MCAGLDFHRDGENTEGKEGNETNKGNEKLGN
jgi:hypothetical protein